MNHVVALIIAGALLLAAVMPVAAINDGTSNTRGEAAARGGTSAGQHGTAVYVETRASSKVCIVGR